MIRICPEVRKGFPIVAGLFIIAAIFLPLWSVSMTAPQYPDQDLVIRVYTDRMAGDVEEYNILNQYVGVTFPEYLPEFEVLPLVLAGFGVFSIVVGFLPPKVKKWALPILLVLYSILLVGGVADLQYRLYVTGHDLDPNAPMQGIGTFTPPLIGVNQVWNFTTTSLIRSGIVSMGLAFILILIAFFNRDNNIVGCEWVKKQKNRFSKLLTKK